MPEALLEALLDSWDRNNLILVNLLRALPENSWAATALPNSLSVGQMFAHIHYCRLVFVEEDAPEAAIEVPQGEWRVEPNRERMEEMLNQSARVLREAVQGRIKSGRAMDQHYDHPILMLQHMVWHEGYHHGQIKLALKAAGTALDYRHFGPVTWSIWMKKEKDRAPQS